MEQKEFDQYLDKIQQIQKDKLSYKRTEYTSGVDCLQNFKDAGRINLMTPEKVLWGYTTKHLCSIIDIVNSPNDVSEDKLLEKITDMQCYLSLLACLIAERNNFNT